MRLKKHKRIRPKLKKLIRRAYIVVIIFFTTFGLLVWGAHDPRVRVADVFVEGNSALTNQVIVDHVRERMRGKYALVFPKDNVFILPRSHIIQSILGEFKRVKLANIDIIDFTSIKISIVERDPYALWCGNGIEDSPVAEDSASCYFVDDSGFVFARAPDFSGGVYFTLYGELTSIGAVGGGVAGDEYLGADRFGRLLQVRALLRKEGLDTSYLSVRENGDIAFGLRGGGKIILNESQDMEKIIRNLVTALSVKEQERANPVDEIEYIDMRFDNEVIFKYSSH